MIIFFKKTARMTNNVYTVAMTTLHIRMDRTPSSSGLNNFLFRGNQPINGSEFAYESLVSTMRSLTAANGVKLPDNFTLLDVR